MTAMVRGVAVDFTSLWCDLMFEELVRWQVRHVCLAPGSRSAPLTLAAHRHSELTCHSHFDERGLGFYALGLARSTSSPVVVLTTSGTAVVNLAPALQEAREAGVSLIVLTADRPPELLGCGNNQTMEQNGVFGRCPVLSVQLPPPDAKLPARWLLSTLDEVMSTLDRPDGGVVHINQALREPLYGQFHSGESKHSEWLLSLKRWETSREPLCQWHIQTALGNIPDFSGHHNIVVLAGELSSGETEQVQGLATRTGWLMIADIQSGLHGKPGVMACADSVLCNPVVHSQLDQATLVIQFGRRLVSKRVGLWLKGFSGEHWYVDPRNDRHDPYYSVSRRFSGSIESFCQLLVAPVTSAIVPNEWCQRLMVKGQKCSQLISDNIQQSEQLTEAWAAQTLKTLAGIDCLFVGNSMPIRLLDSLSTLPAKAVIKANRGISGIDGLMATACGEAAGHPEQRTALLIGDLSFLHDLNSLALVKRHGLLIVLLNNSGGSIFNMFPVSDPEVQAHSFQLSHTLTAEGAATMFGLRYLSPKSRCEFSDALSAIVQSSDNAAAIIEVNTPSTQATDQLKTLQTQIRKVVL